MRDFPHRLPGLPRPLELVRELEAFEGPILSELRVAGGRGGIYLEKWCTREGAIDRWLIVRTEQRAVAEYLSGRLSLLVLLTDSSDGYGYIVDRAATEIENVFLVAIAELPTEYLPRPTAYHDEALRPNWAAVPQSFLLGPEWDGRQIASIERLYHSVASFAFFTEPGKGRSLPGGVLNFEYDRGFPIVSAFGRMRAAVPREQRAYSAGVAASSPGVFTLNAPAAMANRLADILAALPDAEKPYEVVYSWSRISPKALDDRRMPELSVACGHLDAICQRLNVDRNVLLPPGLTSDPLAVLTAGKLMAAYYRMLWRLLESDGAEFVSVKRLDRGPSAALSSAYDDDDDDEEII